MKKLILSIFFIAFSGIIAAQSIKIDSKSCPKRLDELSTTELNAIFDRINPKLKAKAIQELGEQIGEKLNGTLLISLDDKIIVRKTCGYARLYKRGKDLNGMTISQLNQARAQSKNKLTNSSPYELASVSKQFTAAAILKLASQGKLNLNDNLSKYYPNNPYPGITVHHLLSHTSGLPEYFDFPDECWGTSGYVSNATAIQKVFSRHEKSMFKPGTRYKYVNTNYLILADLVSKVSGMKFERYMADSIFNPIGMNNTFYFSQKTEHKEITFPRGHLGSGEEVAFEPLDGTLGDKGLYSCPEALMKWKIAYFTDCMVIPREWVEKAMTPQNNLIGGARPSELYGYGLHIEEDKHHGKIVYHGGLWHGFHHIMVYRPSDNVFFACLSNYRNRVHIGLSEKILGIIDGV